MGGDSPGEVEPLLVVGEDGALVGLDSDHTDRAAEAWLVPHSKQLCGTPVASELWRFDEIAAHWDPLVLRAWIQQAPGREWVLHQRGCDVRSAPARRACHSFPAAFRRATCCSAASCRRSAVSARLKPSV